MHSSIQQESSEPATTDGTNERLSPDIPGGGRGAAQQWRAQFVLLAAIWGLSFLFIKVADESLAPVQVALTRTVLGAATLLLILAVRRERLPHGRKIWTHLAVAALLFNAAPFSLYAYGETQVSSVLAGIWNASTPLLTLVVVMLTLPNERPTRQRVAGLVVGFAGVLVVLGLWRGVGGHALIGNIACLGAAGCYAVGFPYIRRHLSGREDSAVAISAAQLMCATVELALIAPFFGGPPSGVPLKVMASLLALGALGSGVAYILNFNLIRNGGATIASTVTYVVPLFSTAAGVLILHEPLSWNQPVGALVVIFGVALSQGRIRLAPRRGRAVQG